MSRRRTTTMVAAAILMCATLAGCGGESRSTQTSSADPTTESVEAETSDATPLALVADAPPAGRCMVPTAEALATQDTAFEGTVTSLADGTATLEVEQWFTGDSAAETVTVSTPSEQLQDLLVAVDFQEGQTYLVSSLGGRVSLCGFTAESSPRLEALYEEAFAR